MVNKMVLYGTRTLKELKNKLRIYTKYVTTPQTTKDKAKMKEATR